MNIQVKILAKQQIDKIHSKSLKILEEIGVFVPHEEVLSRFRNSYDNWVKKGAKTMEDRYRLIKEETLAKHEPVPLPTDIKNDPEKPKIY